MRLAGKTALLWHPAANCIARGVDQNFQTVQMHGLQEQDEAPWQRYVLTRQLRSSCLVEGKVSLLQVLKAERQVAWIEDRGIARHSKWLHGYIMATQHGWHVATSEEISDILIPAGASLLDGLRLLLVHHLRASAGTAPWQLASQHRRLLLICCYNNCCFLIDFLKGGRPDTWRLYPRGLRSFGGSTEEIYGALAWNGIVVSCRLPQVCNILQSFRKTTFNVRWHPLTHCSFDLVLIEGSLEVKLPTIWTDEKQRWEESEKRREERESLRRKKIQVREKVGKSRNAVFFQWFVAPEGRKVGSLNLAKAAGAEPAGQMRDKKLHAVVARSTFRSQNAKKHLAFGAHLEVETSKTCTALRREAHFEVKMYKTPHLRTTFGSWDVEKVHAVVARRCAKHISKSTCTCSDHFWKLRCRKSARRCGGKHISKSKCTKHFTFGPLLEVKMSKKCTPLWCEAHFEANMLKTFKNTTCSDHFLTCRCRFAWQAQGIVWTLSKVSKTWGFCSMSKNDGRRGAVDEGLQRWISRGRRSTRDMFIRDVRRSGRWFPERGCILEHQIFRFAEMILRWQVQHFVWPGITFSWQAQYFSQYFRQVE